MCNIGLAAGSLASHIQDQHGVDQGDMTPLPPTIRGQDLPDILTVSSTKHCLPCRGIIGEGNEPQRTPGTLCEPPRMGYCSDPGGGNPPHTALSQVLHNHHMEGSQRQVSGHGDVLQGRGEDLEAMAGGRGTEEHGGDLSGLWETFGNGVISQINWEEYHSIR